ncbi:MAG: hypothetical protein [Circular genetic element sp.]|nr:MAG: hypothetical protein [Circular genetic element sp.]
MTPGAPSQPVRAMRTRARSVMSDPSCSGLREARTGGLISPSGRYIVAWTRRLSRENTPVLVHSTRLHSFGVLGAKRDIPEGRPRVVGEPTVCQYPHPATSPISAAFMPECRRASRGT